MTIRMNEAPKPYTTIHELIADRVHWAVASLHGLVQDGRKEGWLAGEPTSERVDLDAVSKQITTRLEASHATPQLLPLRLLDARLELNTAQRDLLWLLAAIEISPAAACIASAFASDSTPELNVQIVQQLVPLTTRELEELQQLGLVELVVDPDRSLQRRTVRIHDRVLELLRGELSLDRDLQGLAEVVPPQVNENLDAVSTLVRAVDADPAPWIVAVGPDGAGRATLLVDSAARAGHGALCITTSRLARDAATLERQLRAIMREAYLFDIVPVFENFDIEPGPMREIVETCLATYSGPIMASAKNQTRLRERSTVCHVLERPDARSRRRCWESVLSNAPAQLAETASQYALWPGGIVEAARNARAAVSEAISAADIHDGIRAYLGDQLGSVASRVSTQQTWDDLVLPSDQFEQVIELVARVRHRERVLDTWGFRDKVGRGHGTAALFSGPPGTGKTMVAGLIAKELGLDLYQVDLSKVVSKYIGETEKQLATLFDAAETGHSIILFDEADSLFAKRSEVKSSNDRYANLEVNYLLQRLEAFTGIALLTTNHEISIDAAFRRRLAIHLRFPTPDETQREQLWRAMIPAAALVTNDINFARLASEFEMTGGYIKNAVVRAAYLAADEDVAIGLRHLWKSARCEYEAMGKVAYQRVA